MELLLVDSLLSHCTDHASLVNELSNWGADSSSSPTSESLELLRLVLGRLASLGARPEVPHMSPLIREVSKLAIDRCLPLLTTLREGHLPARDVTRVARTICVMLRHCTEIAGVEVAVATCQAALMSLSGKYIEQVRDRSAGVPPVEPQVLESRSICIAGCTDKTGRWMAVEEAIEALGAVVPTLLQIADSECSNEVEKVVEAVVSVLREGTDEAANLVCGRLLPCLGEDCRSLKHLWGHVMEDKGLMGDAGGVCLSRRLLVLSTLSDHLFSVESAERSLNYLCCNSFWVSVQEGLSWPDSLTRKRAIYLLKRALDLCQETGQEITCKTGGCLDGEPALFFWSSKTNETHMRFWENFLLVIETLEGNQIHVIKPVLPKLNIIFEYTVSENKDVSLFHPTWHLCIYKRMFESENRTLAREGILHFLDLYGSRSSPGSAACAEFIIGPLMDAMSESAIFSRSPGQLSGECPLLGTKFQAFLASFVTSLPEENRGSFLLKFIKKMTSRHWCAVPILFMTKALADLPLRKVWGVEGLLLLRDVLQCTMTTHQILLRGAAQCFLLQAAMKLTDVEKVSLSDVSHFLMSVRSEESLHRGSQLWKELCTWFSSNDQFFKKADTFDLTKDPGRSSLCMYTQCLVEDYLAVPASKESKLMPDFFESRLVSNMILLAADIELMECLKKDKAEPTELRSLLCPLLECLAKLSTNAYMATLKTDKCLQLLLKLLQTSAAKSAQDDSDDLSATLWNLILGTAPSVLEFVLRRLSGELKTVADLDRCDLYLAVLSELVKLSLRFGWKRSPSVWKYIYYVTTASIENLQHFSDKQDEKLGDQIQKVVSMASLASVCGIASTAHEFWTESPEYINALYRYLSSVQLNRSLSKPTVSDESWLEETTSQGWGKIVARYLHDQWFCLHFVLQKQNQNVHTSETEHVESAHLGFQTAAASLQSALNALSIIPTDKALPVFHCMKLIVPKVLHFSEALCVEAINVSWKIVFSLCNTQLVFWPNLKAFVEFVFSNEILSEAASTKGQLYHRIKEIIRQIVDMSSTKTGVFNVLVSYCCQSWIDYSEITFIKDKALLNAKHYVEILTEACVFGTVFRRDQRLIQDVHAFIENLGKDCAANGAIKSINRDEHQVRTCAITFLSLLDGSNPLHKEFLEDLVSHLLDKDVIVSKTKTRYYANSLQHRVKNRLWQTLLILIPKLDQNFLSEIIERIFQAGFSNNQSSVKYLIEWIIILILHSHPSFLSKFWDCFCCTEEKLKTSVCTFLSVLPHFDVIIENVPDKVPSLKKALVTVLQWCFNHNFSVRLYALIALKKLWAICKEQCIQEFETLSSVIESSLHQVENIQGGGNARKNWLRIQEHFFFSTFHPLEDFSIETIFYTLPSLSELIEDEWIPSYKFSNNTDIVWKSSIPLVNSRNMICNLNPNDWSQQDIGDIDSQSEWADIQKKIIPWKNSIPDLALEMDLQYRAAKLGKSNGNLIVVASLIDKPTNLGGLCRTCEIFGASALVVDSLHYVNDKQFQYLSVSAEQWVPLIEVKPQQLLQYLQVKKTEGYTIIGVEQTAKSSDLSDYSFPEKSLLLLGNEREGIPANLIQHLDVCVEIPQQGIIRSLNVHVSGAVLIWEYTRQHIMKKKERK
ncbi:putative methyltransferase TARBP1 [Rhinophrynus dorsalis]